MILSNTILMYTLCQGHIEKRVHNNFFPCDSFVSLYQLLSSSLLKAG